MNQQITTITSLPGMPRPDPVTGRLERRIVAWMPSDPSQQVGLVRPLTDGERDGARERIYQLGRALSARDPRALERSVAGMLLSFPSGRANGEEARAVVGAYAVALSDLPPWAVNEAARRWTRGEVAGGNPTFPPSSAELHQAATSVVDGFRREAWMLERMLAGAVNQPAPKLSRERRAEIETEARRNAAQAGLDSRAAAKGLDPEATMAGIADAKPPASTFNPLDFDPLGR